MPPLLRPRQQPLFGRLLPRLLAAGFLLVTMSACGAFGEPETMSLDDAFGTAATEVARPEAAAQTPLPETASADAATPVADGAPTALPAASPTATTAPTPTPVPTPAWQPVQTSDGLAFEVPSSWVVLDDQDAIDELMTNAETTAALQELGVEDLLPLFDVRVRALIDAPDASKVIYVTISRSPFPTIQLLEQFGDMIAAQAGVTITDRAFIDTPLGPGLRAETDLSGTNYVEWFWIEGNEARVLIFRSETDAERHAIETLSDS